MDHSALQRFLGYELARARVETNRAFFDSVGGPLQLRPLEFSLLLLLRDNEGISQHGLALTLNLRPPNLTTLLARLTCRGLVHRECSDVDRRVQRVRLTPGGAELVNRASKAAASMEDSIRHRYSAAEWALLLELLHRAGPANPDI